MQQDFIKKNNVLFYCCFDVIKHLSCLNFCRCLEETQWDFQRAITVFQNLHSQGVVPPQAFVK